MEEKPFWDHVEDLRVTLIKVIAVIFVGFILALTFYQTLFEVLTKPLIEMTLPNHSLPLEKSLVLLSPLEGITTTLQTCFWTALVGTSPLWLYFVLQFISPGLHKKEKRMIVPFFIFSILFFCGGISFAHQVTIPIANEYLQLFNSSLGVNLWSLSHYVSYTLILLLGNGLGFEASVILLILVHYGIISPQALEEKRRHMIVAAFIIAAILTPPDVITQFLLAVPLISFYELSIIYGKIRNIRRRREWEIT